MCIFSAEVPAYACMKAGAAALKSNCASNIFLRESNCLNARHSCTVASEGTRPQGRGVPKYEKITVSFSRHAVSCRKMPYKRYFYSQKMRIYAKNADRSSYCRRYATDLSQR